MLRAIIFSLCAVLAFQSSNALARSRTSSGLMFKLAGALVIGAAASVALQQKQCKKAVATGAIGGDIPRACYSDQVLERSYGTGTLRGQLDIERQSMGMMPNPDDCDGHHIIPQKEGRAWAEKSANAARNILQQCGIDLNSAQNGVYLPSRKEGSQNYPGQYHKGLHTRGYYDYVAQALKEADAQLGCDGVLSALQRLKLDLINGVIW